MPAWLRIRLPFIALVLITIGVGLRIHWTGYAVPPAARDILGDALWAMMIFWWMGVAAPRAPTWRRGIAALGICFAVEVSQLYHAPRVDALRSTPLGQLVLGSGFDARDLGAYAVGVFVAVLFEGTARRRRTSL